MYYHVFELHAELLKALSHPKRLEIIHLLRRKELSVTEIQEMLNMPQANLSQHLMILRDAQVVVTRRNGKQIYYRLTHKNFIKASDLVRQILIERHKDEPIADEFSHKMSDLVPLTQDPVCGMRLSPKTASFAKRHNGVDYYFCASGCLDKFNQHPQKFLHKGA
ncbi:YHS domain-containing protein [Candidatus Microgenomates bacterium]|nr:MAG: YHS domain-containing protein [Candidatus Microgenomates bacterium]